MNSSISTKTNSLYSRICKLIKEYSKAVNGVSTSFLLCHCGIPSTAHILEVLLWEQMSEGVIDKKYKVFWL
jgi:hypothetical protein